MFLDFFFLKINTEQNSDHVNFKIRTSYYLLKISLHFFLQFSKLNLKKINVILTNFFKIKNCKSFSTLLEKLNNYFVRVKISLAMIV